MRLYTALLLVFATSSWADHVVHEKRDAPPHGWERRQRVNPDIFVPLRIGLRQQNLHRAEEYISQVSDPRSPSYGKHWTSAQIVNTFASSEETMSEVKKWLSNAGIDPSRIKISNSKSWITVTASISEAESLLQTNYFVFEHQSHQPHIACESYSLPEHLSARHIDLVTPTVHFDAKAKPYRRDVGRIRGRSPRSQAGRPRPAIKVGERVTKNAQAMAGSLAQCSTQITPDCLRALYGFSAGTSAVSGNSFGIVEFSPESYVPKDLDTFFKLFSPSQVGQRPVLQSIGGAQPNGTDHDESNLDLQYAMALVYPQKQVMLYQLDGAATFNNFLDAFDSTYCSGDSPVYDKVYPNKNYRAKDCGNYTAANVISVSWGYDEQAFSSAYLQRQCNEFMKLGLKGITVLFSSGDSGVAGGNGQCIKSTQFNPDSPATCPYITAVGATMVKPGSAISSPVPTTTQPEVAWNTMIGSSRFSTGGGFSGIFSVPSYQSAAVQTYLKGNNVSYTSKQYSGGGGTARGFPDVSANGHAYVVVINGQYYLVDGTSAAAPTFGSLITLINEQRIAAKKSPVGFLNPVLYAHPEVLKDVVSGNNPGCNTQGFSAASGWDPVTGLGTPIYSKMLSLFMSLP